MADPASSRTWVHDFPRPGVPSSRHRATLLINDEVVGSAEGDDWVDAAHNLREVLRERGIAPEGRVLAVDVFEQIFRYRQSPRP